MKLTMYLLATTAVLLPMLLNAARIDRFLLTNVNTGRSRPLAANSTVRIRSPYVITAVASASTRYVTFSTPLLSTSRQRPFRLDPGVDGLPFGPTVISAFPNEQTSARLSISVFILPPGYPLRGPLPRPTGAELLAVPTVSRRCRAAAAATAPITISDITWRRNYDTGGYDFTLYAVISFCNAASQDMRVRYLTYVPSAASGGPPVTDTLDSRTKTVGPGGSSLVGPFEFREENNDQIFYVDACIRLADGSPLCATSQLYRFPAYVPSEPLPLFRPPISLRLAPGDAATLTYSFANETDDYSPLGNGGAGHYPARLVVLQTRLQRRSGSVYRTYARRRGGAVPYTVDLFGRRGAVRGLNGGLVHMSYFPRGLPSLVTDDLRISTKIVVGDFARLARQDIRLPEFEQPVYTGPDVYPGDAAKISVNATNSNGGGRLANGRPPRLHYQWYLRNYQDYPYPTYADPIRGATGATLNVDRVQCYLTSECTTLYGCYSVGWYYVDVCNTFGCRRSERIVLCQF